MLGDPTTRPCFKSVEMFGFIWSSNLCLPSHQCNEWIMDLGLLRILGLLGCVFMLNLHYYFGSGSNDQMMNDLHWANHGKILGKSWSSWTCWAFLHFNSAAPHSHLRNTQSHQRRGTSCLSSGCRTSQPKNVRHPIGSRWSLPGAVRFRGILAFKEEQIIHLIVKLYK